MIAAWMLYAVVVAVLVGLAAVAIERVCRMHGRPTRWIWIGAMCAPFVLSLAAWSGNGVVASDARRQAEPVIALEGERTQARPPRRMTGTLTLPYIAQAAQTNGDASLDRTLLIAWSVASGAMIIVLGAGWLQLQRRSRAWRRTRIAGIDVLVGDEVGPAVFGVFRPRIVAPRWLIDADRTTQDGAIVHELQHIAARDAQLTAAALLLVVATPWNLPLWVYWRRLRAAIEIDCDARVLRSGQRAEEYGAALLNVAERRIDSPLLAPAMHDASCALERRIALLFAERSRRSALAAVVLTFAAAAFTAAAAQIAPPAHSPTNVASASSVATAEGALGRVLVEAAQRGDFDQATKLIDAGANVDQAVLGDGSPLIIAARRGDLRLVQLLLENGAAPDVAVAGDGNPLIMAAGRGHDEIVAALLARGANVNAVVIGDETPLINAARGGHLPIVRTLVERGADVTLAVPADGSPFAEIRSPLSEAKKHGHRAVVEYLRGQGAA